MQQTNNKNNINIVNNDKNINNINNNNINNINNNNKNSTWLYHLAYHWYFKTIFLLCLPSVRLLIPFQRKFPDTLQSCSQQQPLCM